MPCLPKLNCCQWGQGRSPGPNTPCIRDSLKSRLAVMSFLLIMRNTIIHRIARIEDNSPPRSGMGTTAVSLSDCCNFGGYCTSGSNGPYHVRSPLRQRSGSMWPPVRVSTWSEQSTIPASPVFISRLHRPLHLLPLAHTLLDKQAHMSRKPAGKHNDTCTQLSSLYMEFSC